VVCEHLAPLQAELLASGIEGRLVNRPWSENARDWWYVDVILDRPALRTRLAIPEVVTDHEHWGTVDGQEAGFVCRVDHDGVMGHHPKVHEDSSRRSIPVYR
jgi:hypothetical protein